MSLQDQHGNPFADSLRFTIDIGVPSGISLPHYHAWAAQFVESSGWPQYDGMLPELPDLDLPSRVFIQSHLCLWQVFFELGRLPVFDIFQIQSLTLKDPIKKIYSMEVDFLKLEGISLNAYQIPLSVSLKITQWMAQQMLHPKNIKTLHRTIDQEIIQPMHRVVPSGQSTIALLKVAYQLKIPFMHLGQGIYQLGWGSRARRLDRSSTQFDALMGAKLSQNKISTAQLLKMAGLPVPHHIVVYGEQDALRAAHTLTYPVVIKPADQDRGEGVTVGVKDDASVRQAFALAQRASKSKEVLVEQHIPGICHRLLVVGSQVLYCVKRQAMGVWADGQRSIAQLIKDELAHQAQKPPWQRSKLQELDSLALETLEYLGLTPETIAPAGQFIALRRIESTQWGGVDVDMTNLVHPHNRQIAVAAAQLLNLHVAGIDIITQDIGVPWYDNHAVINEVNFAPLLGGAAISRSYLPQFFDYLFGGVSKIPLEIFDQKELARQRQNFYKQQGLRTYYVSMDGIEDPWGQELKLSSMDVRTTIKALLCRADVDALVAVI